MIAVILFTTFYDSRQIINFNSLLSIVFGHQVDHLIVGVAQPIGRGDGLVESLRRSRSLSNGVDDLGHKSCCVSAERERKSISERNFWSEWDECDTKDTKSNRKFKWKTNKSRRYFYFRSLPESKRQMFLTTTCQTW
jgi:hypothetical protein